MTTRLILKNINTAQLDAQVQQARQHLGCNFTRSDLIREAVRQLYESGRQPSSLQKGFPDLIQDCIDWINRQPRKGRRRFRWARARWLSILDAMGRAEA